MNTYIVLHGYNYEGTVVKGVFGTYEEAREFAKNPEGFRHSTIIQHWLLGGVMVDEWSWI